MQARGKMPGDIGGCGPPPPTVAIGQPVQLGRCRNGERHFEMEQ